MRRPSDRRSGDRLLVPEMTILDGKIVYFQGWPEFLA